MSIIIFQLTVKYNGTFVRTGRKWTVQEGHIQDFWMDIHGKSQLGAEILRNSTVSKMKGLESERSRFYLD